MDIDITTFFAEANTFDFSRSVAEYGPNVGPTAWTNAKREGETSPLLTTPDQLEALRDHVKGFGKWEPAELAAWSDVECNALFIQLISGDIREAGLDNDPDDDDWQEYERRAAQCDCSGRIFKAADGNVYYTLGD